MDAANHPTDAMDDHVRFFAKYDTPPTKHMHIDRER